MKTLIAVFALTIAALGQSAPTCPVQIYGVFIGYNTFTVHFQNVSDKKIVGAEFMGYDINAVGNKHWKYAVMFEGKAKPGDKKQAEARLFTSRNIGSGAVLLKARFEDGSVWSSKDGFMNKECLFEKSK
jgi:hypothetical protein